MYDLADVLFLATGVVVLPISVTEIVKMDQWDFLILRLGYPSFATRG